MRNKRTSRIWHRYLRFAAIVVLLAIAAPSRALDLHCNGHDGPVMPGAMTTNCFISFRAPVPIPTASAGTGVDCPDGTLHVPSSNIESSPSDPTLYECTATIEISARNVNKHKNEVACMDGVCFHFLPKQETEKVRIDSTMWKPSQPQNCSPTQGCGVQGMPTLKNDFNICADGISPDMQLEWVNYVVECHPSPLQPRVD